MVFYKKEKFKRLRLEEKILEKLKNVFYKKILAKNILEE